MYIRFRFLGTILFVLFFLNSHAELSKASLIKLNEFRTQINKYKVSQIDSAFYYSEKGIEYFKSEKNKIAEAFIILDKAEVYEVRADFSNARSLALKALDLFYEQNYNIGLSETYHFLGIIEARQSNLSQATSYFLRSIYLAEKTNNTYAQISNYISYSMLLAKLNQYDKAEIYLYKALKLNGKNKGGAYLNINNNLGILYGMQGKPLESLKYLKLALSVPDSPQFISSKVSLFMNAGNANNEIKNYTEALYFYNKGLDLAVKYDLREQEAQIIFNKAIMYEETDVNQCLNHLQIALSKAKEIGQRQLCVEILTGLYQIKKGEKDYRGSLEAMEQLMLYQDSILNFDVKKDIEILQSNYELEKAESSFKDLELKNQTNRVQLQIGILLAIALLLIAVILYYYLNKTNKLNHQLEDSVNVRDKLLSIIAHDLRTPITNINSLLNEIKSATLSKDEQEMLINILHQNTIATEETLDNLLKWGQLQLKGVKVNQENIDVKHRSNKIIDLLSLQALSKDIKFVNNINENHKINFDKVQFDFILRNVLSNAIKFSKFYSSITMNFDDNINGYSRLQIIDQGVGIAPDKLNDIFSNNTVSYGTNNEKGIGLGLGMIREYMQANEGEINIESELGKGTIVNLYFKK